MDNFNDFISTVKSAKNALIVSHVNPDGDTLGSMISLYEMLKLKFGLTADMLILSDIPEIYKFLPDVFKTKKFDDLDKNFVYDVAISVDVASVDRMIFAYDLFCKAKVTVNFDHHKTNKGFATLNYISSDVSSTGELLFSLFKNDFEFDKDIATNLYCAIMTDTGCFRFENTSEKTFLCASELLKYGISPAQICKNCYDSKPKSMVMLSAYAINKAEFLENDKITYAILTLDDMKKLNATSQDTEGISETLRQIRTTEVAMLLRETTSGYTKVSLRSKTVDIAKVAEVFGGGGHTFAAGCTIKKPPSIALDKLHAEIVKQL